MIIFICWEILTYPIWVSPPNLELFFKKVHVKEAALDNCRVFMDGTVRPVYKPTNYQKATSSGGKRIHAVKFQSVIAPNELYCKFVWSSWRKKRQMYIINWFNAVEKQVLRNYGFVEILHIHFELNHRVLLKIKT